MNGKPSGTKRRTSQAAGARRVGRRASAARRWLVGAGVLLLLVALAGALAGCGGTSSSQTAGAAVAPAGASSSASAEAVAFTSGVADSPTPSASASAWASPAPTDVDTSAASTPTSASTSSASPTPTASSSRKATATPTPAPTKTARPPAPSFTVSGKVVATTRFTVARLKTMNTVAAEYFSRGKDPKEDTNAFVGVRLSDILAVAGLASDARRVTVTAADGYSASFTLRQVNAVYIDETRPDVTLPMIIAYSEDGKAYTGGHPFRLVMGQTVPGDYNRQYWVRIVVSVTVL